ncbi:DUF202 domain-containing protein [Corynebacterium halotolerans]|uniref:DUF202 domain-containing protein n=1 Tax=Corynebacterium halotolerans TaxID=225326 RepID=UPI003CF6BC13
MTLVARLHNDPGLQPERTSLSWARTTVSFAVTGAVLLRWANHFPALIYALVAVMSMMALAIYLTQRRRYLRAGSGLAEGRIEASVGTVLAMMLGLVLLGIAGLVLVYLGVSP